MSPGTTNELDGGCFGVGCQAAKITNMTWIFLSKEPKVC